MPRERVSDVVETDVVVIGGGIGGPFAALYASEGGGQGSTFRKGSC